jgi:hypothetical protein
MRRLTTIIMTMCCVVAQALPQAPDRASASLDLDNVKVTIHYGVPTLAGRKIDELIMPGFAWRIGMNEPTTLETTAALDFYGKSLPAGKYILFARPDEHRNWVLLISSQTAGSVLDPATVVLEAPLFLIEDEQVRENLEISLQRSGKSAWMIVAWGTYRLRGTFTVH